MKVLKTIFIVLLAILFTLGLAVDIIYIWVFVKAPNKIVSQTFNVGLQELGDETTKEFVEINYYSNKNNNGIECFEIKFNYISDENKNMFYSQGLQFLSIDDNPIEFKYYYSNASKSNKYYRKVNSFGATKKYFDAWGYYSPSEKTKCVNYASSDDGKTSVLSTNPLNNQTNFLIEIGSDLYKMKFKNIDTEKLKYSENVSLWQSRYVGTESKDFENYLFYYVFSYWDYYYNYDLNYFSYLLKNSVSVLKDNTSQQMVFEFGDLFDYYKYDADKKVYVDISVEDSLKIKSDIKSYYCIKVNYSDDGLVRAKQSLFNNVNCSPNYNTSGDYSEVNFLYGRSVIDVSYGDFELVKAENDTYNLILKQSFLDKYTKYKDTIELNVYLDFDLFKNHNIKVNYPDFKDFKIIRDNIKNWTISVF